MNNYAITMLIVYGFYQYVSLAVCTWASTRGGRFDSPRFVLMIRACRQPSEITKAVFRHGISGKTAPGNSQDEVSKEGEPE